MIAAIVHRYQAVFVFTAMVILLGLTAYSDLPREHFPEIRRPQIFVTTTYSGVSAMDMESLITRRIEKELDGLEGLDHLTSSSSFGMSMVTAEFTGDTEVEIALRRVKERVDIARTELPHDADEPIVRELNFSDLPVLVLAVTNPAGLEILEDPIELLEESLEEVPGVREIEVEGKLEKEVVIDVDPGLLRHYGFALKDVIDAVNQENTTIPGGVLKSPDQDFSLSVSGEIKEASQFAEISLSKDGKTVKLKDLAQVSFTYVEPTTYSRVNHEPAVSLNIKKRSGANILALIDEVKERVTQNAQAFPPKTQFAYTTDTSRDVLNMIYDLENNILTGLAFVILVTLFFLGPLNAAFVSLGIPFSMLIAFYVIQVAGMTLNMVVLFSLILALGMLVDNGIVVVENIYRHRSLGKDRVQAAIDGCREVAIPISTSTLTTVLAFLPIIFMPGIMGEFMAFLPKTVIIVLVASLIVALSITTTFCSRFLRFSEKAAAQISTGSSRFQAFQERYVRLLSRALDHPKLVVGSSFLLVILGIVAHGSFGRDAVFFPKADPPAINVSVKMAAGTPLSQTDAFTQKLENVAEQPAHSIENIQGSVGMGDGPFPRPDASQGVIRIGFLPFVDREVKGREYMYELIDRLRAIPGAELKAQSADEGPPDGHDISYEVSGTDYLVMEELAGQVFRVIESHRSAFEQYETDLETAKPEVRIEVDRARAAHYGLNTRMIAETIRAAMVGQKTSIYREGKEEYDIIVRLNEDARSSLANLRELELVDGPTRIALSSVATIGVQSTVSVVNRRERHRAIALWADFKEDVAEKDAVRAKIAEAIAAIEHPEGYHVGPGAGQDVRAESTDFLKQAFLTALLLIFMVLVLQFNSVTQPLIILISVFLSLGGVFWGILVTRQDFVVIMSGIGTISLAGVVVNNAIVMIDFINQLRARGMGVREAVIEGGRVRLRPVLLTAITTVIGLLPMAFGISFDFHSMRIQIGSESSVFWSPMAWTVIYGLSFATVLTLVVVPALVYLDKSGNTWSRLRRLFIKATGVLRQKIAPLLRRDHKPAIK